MANPNTPATASPDVPPPVPRFQIVDEGRLPTASFQEWCQLMWAGVFGTHGLAEQIDFNQVNALNGQVAALTDLINSLVSSLGQANAALALASLRIDDLERSLAARTVTDTDVLPLVPPLSVVGNDSIQTYSGSFTPTVAGSTTPGANTYSLQTGTYVQYGTWIFFTLEVTMTAKDGAMAGNALIAGLPFTAGAVNSAAFPGIYENITTPGGDQNYFEVITATTTLAILHCGAGAAVAAIAADIGATFHVQLTGFYSL